MVSSDALTVSTFQVSQRLQGVPLLVVTCREGKTGRGDPYLALNLRDATGAFDGRAWDTSEASAPFAAAGKVVLVDGIVESYQGRNQLKVSQLQPCDAPAEAFLPAPVPPVELATLAEMQAQAPDALVRTPPLLVTVCARRAVKSGPSQGKAYLSLELRDERTAVDARVWDELVDPLEPVCAAGTVVRITGVVEAYKDELQLRVKAVETTDLSPKLFLPRSKRDPLEMLGRLNEIADSLRHPLDRLVRTVLLHAEEDLGLLDAPAASSNHRAYLGGLLEHTVALAELAILVAPAFEPAGVDPDMVVAGAILHDLGKCREIEANSKIDYGTDGRLLGHVYMGARLIEEQEWYAWGTGEEDPALLRALLHLVLSHHGSKEWGAPVVPQTPDAILLHQLDRLQAHMEMVEEARAKTGADGWTEWVKPLGCRLFFGEPARAERPDGPDDQPEGATGVASVPPVGSVGVNAGVNALLKAVDEAVLAHEFDQVALVVEVPPGDQRGPDELIGDLFAGVEE